MRHKKYIYFEKNNTKANQQNSGTNLGLCTRKLLFKKSSIYNIFRIRVRAFEFSIPSVAFLLSFGFRTLVYAVSFYRKLSAKD